MAKLEDILDETDADALLVVPEVGRGGGGEDGDEDGEDMEALPTPDEMADETADEFSTEITTQLSFLDEKRENWRKWLRLYEAKSDTRRKTFPWEGAANLCVGIAAIQLDQVVARIMQGIFSTEPHWVAKQRSKKFSKNLKPLESWLDWTRQNVWDQYKVVKHALLETCKLGTSIIYNGWINQPFYKYSRMEGRTVENGRLVGPMPQWTPREDFIIPMGHLDIQRAPYVAQRWWLSKTDYQRWVKAGFFRERDEVESSTGEQDTRIRLTELGSDQSASNADSAFGLMQFWQVFFSRDLDGDGFPEEYILWLHPDTKTWVRFEPNPHIFGMRPFVKLCFIEKEGEFDGMGIPERVEQYQEEASTIHNQNRDASSVSNAKVILANRGAMDAQNTKIYPGAVKFVNDIGGIKEFSLGEASSLARNDEDRVVAMANQAVGMTDVGLGNMTAPMGRAAATTVLTQLQEGTRRFDLNTSEIRKALSEQALQIIELYQTHGLPEEGSGYSPEDVLDPEDAALVREIIESEDRIAGSVAITLNVSTAAVNTEIEKQSTIQLYQTVTQHYTQVLQLLPMAMQNPQMAPVVMRIVQGMEKLLENVFQAHKRFDLDEVLIGDLLTQQGEEQNGTTQPAPPTPGMVEGAPSGYGGNGSVPDEELGGPPGGAGQGYGL